MPAPRSSFGRSKKAPSLVPGHRMLVLGERAFKLSFRAFILLGELGHEMKSDWVADGNNLGKNIDQHSQVVKQPCGFY